MIKYILLGIIFVTGCTFLGARLYTVEFFTVDNIIAIDAEVADNPASITRGLMYRLELKENEGMLFIFENSTERYFWMKDTFIPLDIIYIDEDLEIISIARNAQPCISDPCRTYPSNGNARYVIEVRAGFTKEHNIQVGDLVDIKE